MRRLGVVLALLLSAATPASGAIHIYVLAATGDAAPNGTVSAVIESSSALNVARGGAVVFEANVGTSNQPWLYRWQDGKVTLITQTVSQYVAGDDQGNLAWFDSGNDRCWFSVLAPGATVPRRTGCGTSAAGAFTLVDGSVYYVGSVTDPTNPVNVHGGIFKDGTMVAPLPSNFTVGGLLNDGAGTVYVTNYYDGSIAKLVGSSLVPAAPPGQYAFVAAGSGHLLYGSNKQAYDLSSAGTVDLTQAYGRIMIGNSGDVVEHQTDQLSLDRVVRLEKDGPHTLLGVGSKTVDGWRVYGLYPDFATAHVDDGTTAVVATIEKGSTVKTAVLAAVDECFVPKPVGEIPLDTQDQRDAAYESAHSLGAFVTQVKQAIAALKADTRKHPAHKAANDDAIKQLKLQLDSGGGFSVLARSRATDDDKQALVNNAICSWLEQGATTLEEAAKGSHAKEIFELGKRLVDLQRVLDRKVQPDSKEAQQLLETNLVALGERFGGDNGGQLTKKAEKLYELLTKQIAAKDLPKTLRGEIADLAKVLGGKNAGELATQITTLVDVLRGDVDADKQYEVLKDSVSALATRMGIEGLLNAPQARAAMLGFEIGKAFADRMSVDLQLVANVRLKEACLVALARQQGVQDNIGEIDFSKPTKAFTAPNQSHPGWQCWIHPEDNVSGYDNHELVEAFKPAQSLLWGLKKIPEQDVWFDRAL